MSTAHLDCQSVNIESSEGSGLVPLALAKAFMSKVLKGVRLQSSLEPIMLWSLCTTRKQGYIADCARSRHVWSIYEFGYDHGPRGYHWFTCRRIGLSSSEQVLQKAEQVVKTIVNTYPQPNLTAEQIQSRAVNGQDPLTEFSDTCRSELDSLQRQL